MKTTFKIGIGLVLVAGAFNSCSDVSFTNMDSGNGGQCSGAACPPPPPTVNYTDTITIPAMSDKVDVLLVLDNSGSMEIDLTKLADKLDGLVQVLDSEGIDWQMCYTKADSSGNVYYWYNMSGANIVSTGTKILTHTTVDRQAIFTATIGNIPPDGGGTEVPLIAIHEVVEKTANRPCFRADATLATVIISDEDEKSCGGRCQNATSSENPTQNPVNRGGQSYAGQYAPLVLEDDPQHLIAFINSTLGAPSVPKSYINHSIVIRPNDFICYDLQDAEHPAFFGVINAELQSLTGGVLGNICADDYAAQLQVMGEVTAATINSVTLRCSPIQRPVVMYNPVPSPLPTYTYAGNKVTFSAPIPAATVLTVSYTCYL